MLSNDFLVSCSGEEINLWKKSMNWSMRDTVFTERSFRDLISAGYENTLQSSNLGYENILQSSVFWEDVRVPAPSHISHVERFWNILWCTELSQGWVVFLNLVQVRLSDVKKIL